MVYVEQCTYNCSYHLGMQSYTMHTDIAMRCITLLCLIERVQHTRIIFATCEFVEK